MSASALGLPAFLALAAQCAPAMPAERLAAYARVESGFRPAALNVNGPGGGPQRASSMPEAVALAERLVAAGRSVDLGLMQVNSQHLLRFRMTVAEALEPCRNIAVGAFILAAADRAAACIYNTGRPDCRNGYPERIQAAAARLARAEQAAPPPARAPIPEPRPEGWDVFAERASAPAAADPPDGEDDAAPSGRQPRVVVELP